MTTCRDIITLGLRQAKVLGTGSAASAGEADDSLAVLQSLYETWFQRGEFGLFEQVYASSDVTAEEQQRITAESGVTVTLPTTFGSAGCKRAPRELAAIEVAQDGAIGRYVWDNLQWVNVSGLALGDAAPLAAYGKAGLSACFALHHADTFGSQIGAGQKMLSDGFIAAMRSRRIQSNPRATPEYF